MRAPELLSLPLWSVTCALLIAAVALLRRFRRLPRSGVRALWLLVLLRLWLPLRLPCPGSVQRLFSWRLAWDQPVAAEPGLAKLAGQVAPTPVPAPPAVAISPAEAAVSASGWLLLWGVGALLGAAYLAWVYLRSRRRFANAQPVEQAYVRRWLAAHPLRRRVQVRQSAAVSSPLTYGVLRPVILLPAAGTDWERLGPLAFALLHEWCHIRSFDALWKLLAAGALCLHWFNPAVWLFFLLFNRDLELACDERVVRLCGPEARRDYALALLSWEAGRTPASGREGGLYNYFGKNVIKERIVEIMSMKKIGYFSLTAALLLLAGVGAAFATNAPAAITAETDSLEEAAANEREARLADYLPLGLEQRDEQLWYQGQPVRYFWDGFEIDDGQTQGRAIRFEYLNRQGAVDVRTRREAVNNPDGSVNGMGPLLGLEIYQEANVLDTASLQQITYVIQSDSGDAHGYTIAQRLAKYADWGLEYREAITPAMGAHYNIYLHQQLVAAFVDKDPEGSTFSVWSTDHEQASGVVLAVYDEAGRLAGLELATPEEANLYLNK